MGVSKIQYGHDVDFLRSPGVTPNKKNLENHGDLGGQVESENVSDQFKTISDHIRTYLTTSDLYMRSL